MLSPPGAGLSPRCLRILLMGPLKVSPPAHGCTWTSLMLPLLNLPSAGLCPGSSAAACLPHPFCRQASEKTLAAFAAPRSLLLEHHLLRSQLGLPHPSVPGDRSKSFKAYWPLLTGSSCPYHNPLHSLRDPEFPTGALYASSAATGSWILGFKCVSFSSPV